MPYQDTKLLLFALIKLEKFCTKAGGYVHKKSAEKTLATQVRLNVLRQVHGRTLTQRLFTYVID